MNQLQTIGIILSRTDYGEADRIITLITPEHGKLRLMARGVRRPKSKLAGGIELFSVSDITYIKGRGDIGTLISARLKKYYEQIVKDIDRVQLGYSIIKTLNKATEDQLEAEYFMLLENAFDALNDANIDLQLIQLWFEAQLLKIAGHTPNLLTDSVGNKLKSDQSYNFDFEDMAFGPHDSGKLKADHIKTLRLLFSQNSPGILSQVKGLGETLPVVAQQVHAMLTAHIRI